MIFKNKNKTESNGDIACKSNYHDTGKFLEPQMKRGDLELTMKRSSVYTNSFTSSVLWLKSLYYYKVWLLNNLTWNNRLFVLIDSKKIKRIFERNETAIKQQILTWFKNQHTRDA